MNISMEGKLVVITGGSRGIGAAMVEKFLECGAKVVNFDLNEGNEAATYYQVDISSKGEVINAIDHVIQQFKRIDVMINNAGIAHVGTIEGTSEEDLDRLYRINIKGVYNGAAAVIPQMKIQKSGVILNMSSVAASVALPDRFAYSMTKAAVENMTYSIARDFLDYNIRCNCIAPGRVHTPFVDDFIAKNYPGQEKEIFDKLSKTQPIGRMGSAEEIAEMAVYLASDKAAFITGSSFPIDGGFVKLNT